MYGRNMNKIKITKNRVIDQEKRKKSETQSQVNEQETYWIHGMK